MSGILKAGCVCGHDHETHRGEPVDMCLECSCSENSPRCQNCGADSYPGAVQLRVHGRSLIACSRRCALQLEYAASRTAAA